MGDGQYEVSIRGFNMKIVKKSKTKTKVLHDLKIDSFERSIYGGSTQSVTLKSALQKEGVSFDKSDIKMLERALKALKYS